MKLKLRFLLLIAALPVTTALATSAIVFQTNSLASTTEAKVCGDTNSPPLKYDHVLWILEENRSLHAVINTPDAPFIGQLAAKCAYTTNFTDNEPRQNLGPGYHSLSHYLADTSGSNCEEGNGRVGIGCIHADNRLPAHYTLPSLSIFQQIELAGGSWKSYQESSPGNCSLINSGEYVYRHDAAVYYAPIRKTCPTNDVPIPTLTSSPRGALIDDINNNRLPTFAYVTPNLRHDMHDGSVAEGDDWLRSYLEPLFQSQTWKQGKTAVFVIWDEAPSSSQTLPNLVIAPTASGGAQTIRTNGFAVLGATEKMLGLPLLGCASGEPPGGRGQCYSGATTDLRSAFGI